MTKLFLSAHMLIVYIKCMKDEEIQSLEVGPLGFLLHDYATVWNYGEHGGVTGTLDSLRTRDLLNRVAFEPHADFEAFLAFLDLMELPTIDCDPSQRFEARLAKRLMQQSGKFVDLEIVVD